MQEIASRVGEHRRRTIPERAGARPIRALAALALAALLAGGCRGAPADAEDPAPAAPPSASRPTRVTEASRVVVVRRARLVADAARAPDPTGVSRDDLFAGTGSSAHVVRVRTRVPLHIHETHDETVVILKGAGRLTYGQGFGKLVARADVDLFAGDVIFIPRGTMHGFVNMLENGEETIAVSVFAPVFDGKDRVSVEEKK